MTDATMVALWQEQLSNIVPAIHAALAADDCDVVAEQAHMLTSSAAQMNFPMLSGACKGLERWARSGEGDRDKIVARFNKRLVEAGVPVTA